MSLNFKKPNDPILLFILVLGVGFSYSEDRSDLERLKARRDELQIKWQEAEAAKIRLTEIKEKITNLESDWGKAVKMFPSEAEVQTMIQQISKCGTKEGLNFLLLQSGESTSEGKFLKIPVQIRVTGKYHQLGQFLSNIGNLTKIIHIVTLDIKQQAAKYVEAEIKAVIYTVPKVYESIATATDVGLDIESYKYTSKSRDPFVSLAGTKLSGSKTSHLDSKNLRLIGILWVDQGYYALVSDQNNNRYILNKGDKISNGEVVEISKERVVFEIVEEGVATKYELRLQEKKKEGNERTMKKNKFNECVGIAVPLNGKKARSK